MEDIIRKIEVLELTEKDHLVVSIPEHISLELANKIKENFEIITPFLKNKVIVLSGGMELRILREGE